MPDLREALQMPRRQQTPSKPASTLALRVHTVRMSSWQTFKYIPDFIIYLFHTKCFISISMGLVNV